MAFKNISLLLIPPDSGKVKGFTISLFTISATLGALAITLLLTVFWGTAYFEEKLDRSQMGKLQTENRFLLQRLSEMDNALHQVRTQVDEIVTKDKSIRKVFDIPEVDPETRQLGTGGTFTSEPIPLVGEAAFTLYNTQNEIQTLLRAAKFENESYAAVLDEVAGKKFLLDHTPSIHPCDGSISRGFGMKADPFTGLVQLHSGIDFASDYGTPIIATADGKVQFTGWAGRFGKVVIIDHGFGYTTVYGHLSEINVKKGQTVKRWQTIAMMGSTGYSTGPHLHYEVHKNDHPQNPDRFILTEMNTLCQ